MNIKKEATPDGVASFFVSQPHARGGSKRGGYGRKDGNDEVQYFLPKFFFHDLWFMNYDLWIMIYELWIMNYDVWCMM